MTPYLDILLCGNCKFPQNFHTIKLDKTSVLYAVFLNSKIFFKLISSSLTYIVLPKILSSFFIGDNVEY